MSRRAASALAVPLLLVACVAAYFTLFIPASLAHTDPLGSATAYDFHSYFLPKFIYGSRELAHGRFPLWNPYEDAGVPFFATAQPALLYPPKALLFGLLEPVRAYWAFLFVHYLALAGGMWLFLREEGMSGPPAFVGAAVWTFSVPLMTANYHPTRIANMTFVPLAFLMVERIAHGRGRRAVPALVAVVALQLFAGYPECAADLGLLVAIHATTRFFMKEWPLPPWRTVPVFAGAFVLAALVAAVQLVPLVEAAVAAGRDAVAGVTRAAVAEVARGDRRIFPESVAPPALGSVPGLLVFSFLALFCRRGRAAAVGLLACVLFAGWGWLWLGRLPGFSMLRFPFVWVVMTPFFIAWLAAIGCDAFFRARSASSAADVRRVDVVSWGQPLVVVSSVAWAAYCAFEWHEIRAHHTLFSGFWAHLARNVGSQTAAVLGVAGALGLAACAWPRSGVRLRVVASMAALVLLVVSHEASYPFGAPASPFARPGPEGEIKSYLDGSLRLTGRALSMHDIVYGYTITDEIPSALGAEESFLPYRFRGILERYELSPIFGHLDWAGFTSARGYLDALDVELVATPLDAVSGLAQSNLTPIRRHPGSMLFRNPHPMGHAWVDYAVHVVPSADRARDYVLGPHFDPHSEVVLETPPEGTYPAVTDLAPTWPTAERRTSPNEVEYDVELPRPGVLVASESFYPGWRAIVDGAPAKILQADYVLRGVELGAGSHHVRFEYRPRSVLIGAVVTCVGLLVLLGLWLRPGRAGGARTA